MWTWIGLTARVCAEAKLLRALSLCRVVRCTASLCTVWTSAHFTWLFLKILTSVLNRFHSVPLHRVNCQLLSPGKKKGGRGNLFKPVAWRRGWIWKLFLKKKKKTVCDRPTCHEQVTAYIYCGPCLFIWYWVQIPACKSFRKSCLLI